MSGPALSIDLKKIEKNTRSIAGYCRTSGIELCGVTKVTCGMPGVARAMLAGGVSSIGESRLENIHRIRANGIMDPVILLRIPPLSEVDEIVKSVDISLNSELPVIRALSEAAEKLGRIHEIILMIDLGDLREGIWPDDLFSVTDQVLDLPGIRIAGIGTNLTCYGGVIPTEENMGQLVKYASMVEESFDIKLRYISGGNSSAIPLLLSGKMPKEINHLRIGEGILFGRDTVDRKPVPGTEQDAFILSAEVIELKKKPSVPIGSTGEDAFGLHPIFSDKGIITRAILNIGREDTDVGGLRPVVSELGILGASSDHLLLDVSGVPELQIGDTVDFHVNYSALLAAMTSAYVEKRPVSAGQYTGPGRQVRMVGNSEILSNLELRSGLERMNYGIQEREKTEQADISDAVAGAVGSGCIPLIAGSEHSLVFDGLTGTGRALSSFGLLWIDSMASLMRHRRGEDTYGNKTILAQVMGWSDGYEGTGLRSFLSPENIVLIGLQDVTREESELIREYHLRAYTMEDIDSIGIKEVTRRGLLHAASGTMGIYVSFCPEAVDTLTDGNSSGGLTLREAHLAMEMIAASGLMRAFDVAGYMVKSGQAYRRVIKLILSAFGKRILS